MKKLGIFLAVLLLNLGLASLAYSRDYVGLNRLDLAPLNSWELGYEFTAFDYSEPGLMDEDGFLHGIFGSFTKHTLDDMMYRIEGSFSMGEVDYDGGTWAGTSLTTDGEDFMVNLRGLLGYDFPVGGSIVTPFLGFGYRYLNDDLNGTGAYERKIKYLYSPIGIETASPAGESWIWGLRAEYDLFWHGKVKSYLSDVTSYYNDPVVYQGSHDGYGVRASLYLKRPKDAKCSIAIETFIRYWEVDDSDLSILTFAGVPYVYVYEPDNHITEYGIRVSYIW